MVNTILISNLCVTQITKFTDRVGYTSSMSKGEPSIFEDGTQHLYILCISITDTFQYQYDKSSSSVRNCFKIPLPTVVIIAFGGRTPEPKRK